jgi:hypothetical protein
LTNQPNKKEGKKKKKTLILEAAVPQHWYNLFFAKKKEKRMRLHNHPSAETNSKTPSGSQNEHKEKQNT